MHTRILLERVDMRITKAVAVLISAILIGTIGVASPASASDSAAVSTNEVSNALRGSNSLLVSPGGSASISTNRVRLSASNLSVQLPAGTIGNGSKTNDGRIVYAGNNGSASAVIPSADGAQMLTVIKSRNAPTNYAYPVAGGRLQLTANGGAVVLSPNGSLAAIVTQPWAHDAKGKKVNTYYTTDSTTLTQHIDHRQKDIAYPVTADPRWIEYQWWGTIIHLTNGETRAMANQAQWIALFLGWAQWMVPAFFGGYSLWATGVADRGRCIAVMAGSFWFWEEAC